MNLKSHFSLLVVGFITIILIGIRKLRVAVTLSN
jgi:hypothetical protein